MIGDTIAATLPELRRQAESRMLDTFTISLPGDTVYNPTTQRDEETLTALFTTAGRVKASTRVRDTEAGARPVVVTTRELHIPVDSPAVPVGAVAVPTYVHASSDPTLAGARLRLAGSAPGSQTTARRIEVTEVLT